mgnify:FL=1
MTHSEVIAKWLGKNYAEASNLWFQCVAWAKKYCQERWYPIKWFGGSAYKWWLTGSPFDNTWKKVVKTSFNAPKEWDIIFWDEWRCKYGHVAVASKFCNPALLRYTDQNWTWHEDKIQARFSTYKNCVGWYTKL